MFRRTPAAPVTRAAVEALERRSLLSATIAGAVMNDLSGNGLTADDAPLAGVVVKLYRDVNANGVLDAADGTAVATKTTAADGTFAFGGLATGTYLVEDVPAADQVRTAPALTGTIAVNVTKKNGTYAGNVFANYVKSFNAAALTGVSYTINGTRTVTTLTGNVQPGDTVKVNFTVAKGQVTVSLVSYKATAPIFTATNVSDQRVHDLATGTFCAGSHSLTVRVPDCYFQVDFVGGRAIDKFGPAGSNILYSTQGRLISWANGGTRSCDCLDEKTGGEGMTPGFWKNHPNVWQGYSPDQKLGSVFNVPAGLGLADKTFMQALNFGGGKGVVGAAQNLFRHAVAALLNAAHVHVDYALTTPQIVARVNAALASNNAAAIDALKNELDAFNNAGGGIDAHGNPK